MSNHAVGHAMSEVIYEIVKLHNKQKIDCNTAHDLIETCLYVVSSEDGNGYEAMEEIWDNTCLECLRMIPEGEYIYSISDIYDKYTSEGDSVENKNAPNFISHEDLQKICKGHYSFNICKDCFTRLIKAQIPDADTDAMIQRLEADGHYKESTGHSNL